jgi:hypothetical protein
MLAVAAGSAWGRSINGLSAVSEACASSAARSRASRASLGHSRAFVICAHLPFFLRIRAVLSPIPGSRLFGDTLGRNHFQQARDVHPGELFRRDVKPPACFEDFHDVTRSPLLVHRQPVLSAFPLPFA